MAISKWFHSVGKDVMRKVEEKGDQVEGDLIVGTIFRN